MNIEISTDTTPSALHVVIAQDCGHDTPWSWGNTVDEALAGGKQQSQSDMDGLTADHILTIPGHYRQLALRLLSNDEDEIGRVAISTLQTVMVMETDLHGVQWDVTSERPDQIANQILREHEDDLHDDLGETLWGALVDEIHARAAELHKLETRRAAQGRAVYQPAPGVDTDMRRHIIEGANNTMTVRELAAAYGLSAAEVERILREDPS